MTPPKRAIEELQADSSKMLFINQRLAASYLLVSIAFDYITEANDILSGTGLCIGEAKQLFTRLQKDFDAYNTRMKQFTIGDVKNLDFCNDYDGLKKLTNEYCFN
jgi:hypothetical protein